MEAGRLDACQPVEIVYAALHGQVISSMPVLKVHAAADPATKSCIRALALTLGVRPSRRGSSSPAPIPLRELRRREDNERAHEAVRSVALCLRRIAGQSEDASPRRGELTGVKMPHGSVCPLACDGRS